MRPFAKIDRALFFIAMHVSADCSILLDTPAGVAVYVHSHHVTLFRSIYGPIAFLDGSGYVDPLRLANVHEVPADGSEPEIERMRR